LRNVKCPSVRFSSYEPRRDNRLRTVSSGKTMSDVAVSRVERAHRVIRGILFALAGGTITMVALFVRPHVVGAFYYAPRIDRLFVSLHADPVLIEALRQQNLALAANDEAWAREHDRLWNAERLQGGGPLQQSVMETPASRHLRDIVLASNGLTSHAFLIDARGWMAAEPYLSFNFRQSDKPKFHYTFPLGAAGKDISWVQLSFDGGHPVCWRAETIVDPSSGAPIGVIALELNYLKLGHFGCIEQPLHTPQERATNHVKM
jgi:hypothetical protein